MTTRKQGIGNKATTRRRQRGTGSIFQRKRDGQKGHVWWIQYVDPRTQAVIRESSASNDRGDAKALLDRKLAEIRTGKFVAAERVTFDDLVQLIVNDYRANERKSLPRVEQCIKHLRRYFGECTAPEITPAKVSAYLAWRQPNARPATIANEIGTLGRIFTLAYRNQLVPSRPPFPTPHVRNTRSGFF